MRSVNSAHTFCFPSKWMSSTKRLTCAMVIAGVNLACLEHSHADHPDQGDVAPVVAQGDIAPYPAPTNSMVTASLAPNGTIQGRVVQRPAPQCCNQRADLWGWPLYNAWTPYRKEMNRPRFVGGYIASKIEPTSQEAMAWHEHHAQGDYRNHRPGYVKTYYFPKPWEVLPIDPRPATPPSSLESKK